MVGGRVTVRFQVITPCLQASEVAQLPRFQVSRVEGTPCQLPLGIVRSARSVLTTFVSRLVKFCFYCLVMNILSSTGGRMVAMRSIEGISVCQILGQICLFGCQAIVTSKMRVVSLSQWRCRFVGVRWGDVYCRNC